MVNGKALIYNYHQVYGEYINILEIYGKNWKHKHQHLNSSLPLDNQEPNPSPFSWIYFSLLLKPQRPSQLVSGLCSFLFSILVILSQDLPPENPTQDPRHVCHFLLCKALPHPKWYFLLPTLQGQCYQLHFTQNNWGSGQLNAWQWSIQLMWICPQKNKFHDDILLTGASLKTGAVERADIEARGSGSGRAASRLSCPRGSSCMKWRVSWEQALGCLPALKVGESSAVLESISWSIPNTSL